MCSVAEALGLSCWTCGTGLLLMPWTRTVGVWLSVGGAALFWVAALLETQRDRA